jgi:FKBP-type peptidyl-prolyl cis-trans isomerase FklB
LLQLINFSEDSKGDEMKLIFTMLLGVGLLAGQVSAEEKKPLQTQTEKQSYSMGADIGSRIKSQGIEVDADLFAKGLKDTIAGGDMLMTDDEIRESLLALQKSLMEKQAERTKAAAEKNKQEGEAFLAANRKKEGVVTLPSGLQYKTIKEGEGKSPRPSDTVEVNYRGTLIDGTEFDSSFKRGEPATFPLNQVISGWTEAMQLMKEGGKMEIFVPADLAYGEQTTGIIGPNSTLIFEVELISVKKPHGHP